MGAGGSELALARATGAEVPVVVVRSGARSLCSRLGHVGSVTSLVFPFFFFGFPDSLELN